MPIRRMAMFKKMRGNKMGIFIWTGEVPPRDLFERKLTNRLTYMK